MRLVPARRESAEAGATRNQSAAPGVLLTEFSRQFMEKPDAGAHDDSSDLDHDRAAARIASCHRTADDPLVWPAL